MGEFSLAVHLPVAEGALVFASLSPIENACAFLHVPIELASVGGTVSENSEALPVLLVALPGTLILSHDAILICLTFEQLKTVAVADHFELFRSNLSSKRFDVSFICWRWILGHLSIRLAHEGHLSIVHRAVSCVSQAFVVGLRISVVCLLTIDRFYLLKRGRWGVRLLWPL